MPDPEHFRQWRALEGFNYLDRNNEHFEEILCLEIRNALERFEELSRKSTSGLLVHLPEQQNPFQYQLIPRDNLSSTIKAPIGLDLTHLKYASAAMGSLVYLGDQMHCNALCQFLGRHIWDRLMSDHEELLLALGEARGSVKKREHIPIRVVSGIDALDVPLELLHDGNEYAGLEHPIVRVVRNVRSKAPPLADRIRGLQDNENLRVLLIASDTFSDEPCLGEIPMVDEEIDRISKIMRSFSPLPLGACSEIEVDAVYSWDASLDNVKKKLAEKWDIIHYAGHGCYDENNPGSSKLFFWEEICTKTQWKSMQSEPDAFKRRDRIRRSRGPLKEISANDLHDRLKHPPSVFYLSCCHSAQVAGSHYLIFCRSLGLVDAVIRAGVPIVVGHRWPLVDGDLTIKFVQTLYERLLSEYPPEQAIYYARKAAQAEDMIWASAVMVLQNP
jgi:CHAT domain-containing protein